MNTRQSSKRVLAVASGGGHWVQLRRIASAFEGHRVTFVTVDEIYREEVPAGAGFRTVRDATRWDKFGLMILTCQLLWILLVVRPHVVVSTGAAPGYLALRLASWLGRRTVWIDSIANVEELSMSGRMAGRFVDLWLTQWPELAEGAATSSAAGDREGIENTSPDGRRPEFRGAVF